MRDFVDDSLLQRGREVAVNIEKGSSLEKLVKLLKDDDDIKLRSFGGKYVQFERSFNNNTSSSSRFHERSVVERPVFIAMVRECFDKDEFKDSEVNGMYDFLLNGIFVRNLSQEDKAKESSFTLDLDLWRLHCIYLVS